MNNQFEVSGVACKSGPDNELVKLVCCWPTAQAPRSAHVAKIAKLKWLTPYKKNQTEDLTILDQWD
jgi:hypothetical protein